MRRLRLRANAHGPIALRAARKSSPAIPIRSGDTSISSPTCPRESMGKSRSIEIPTTTTTWSSRGSSALSIRRSEDAHGLRMRAAEAVGAAEVPTVFRPSPRGSSLVRGPTFRAEGTHDRGLEGPHRPLAEVLARNRYGLCLLERHAGDAVTGDDLTVRQQEARNARVQ